MRDPDLYWRNHRWSLDGQYTETENAPLLRELIEKNGKFWDGEYWYIFHGYKKYIVKFPDWRDNYRITSENPKRSRDRKFQRKLFE